MRAGGHNFGAESNDGAQLVCLSSALKSALHERASERIPVYEKITLIEVGGGGIIKKRGAINLTANEETGVVYHTLPSAGGAGADKETCATYCISLEAA